MAPYYYEEEISGGDYVGGVEYVGYDEDDDYDDDDGVAGVEFVGYEDDEDEYELAGDDDEDDPYGLMADLAELEDAEVGARVARRRRPKKRAKRLVRAAPRGLVPVPKRQVAVVRPKKRRLVRATRVPAPMPPRAPSVVVDQDEPSRIRTIPLGGNATQGGVAGQLIISTTVQEPCRVDRLFIAGIDSEGGVLNPASYSISDIKVGTKSQFAALQPLPGIMFQADTTGQGTKLGLDTVQTGTDFSVIIADAPAGSRFQFGAYARALR